MTEPAEPRPANPVAKILAFLGPGLFLIGYNIGTGSITTMASSGSRWGMQLSWTVLLSCVFVFIGIMSFGRYTLATGETILYAIRRNFPLGSAISLFIMISLILAEYAGIAGLMAVVVDLVQEWIRHFAGGSPAHLRVIIALCVAAILFVILWHGRYPLLETVLASLVTLMGFCFLLSAYLIAPPWRSIFTGLVPSVPKAPDASLIVAGMAGTTFSAAMLYCRSITLKAKGWRLDQERRARVDAVVSATAMFVLSTAVMACAAGTLYIAKKPVVDTIDMIRTLEPLAGNFAFTLFTTGILAAGMACMMPTVLIAPWLISDYLGKQIQPKSLTTRVFVVSGLAFGLTGPFMNFKPVFLMIATMALLSLVVPFSMIAITVLLNQKHLGKYRNSLLMNVLCVAAIVFATIMAYYGVIGLIETVRTRFGV